MSKRLLFVLIFIIAVCGFMIGCGKDDTSSPQQNNSGNQNPPAEQPKQQTPPVEQPKPADNVYKSGKVELTLFDHNTGLSDEEFELFYGKLLKAKYPDITVTKVKGPLTDLVASGSTPDLVTISNAVINQYLEVDFPQDLKEMVKKYNIDTGVFVKELMVALNDYSKNGALLGLPFGDNSSALVYNQEIFDKFGMEFPSNKIITLEDYVDLVRLLTRKEGDIQYIGGNVHEVNLMNSAGLVYIDPNNKDKALFSTDQHKYVWSLLQKIYQTPNYITPDSKYRLSGDLFWKDQVMAMNWTWVDNTMNDVSKNKPTFNWNIHSQPAIWKDKPSRNSLDFHLLMVSKVSKNKEAAYAVLSHILSRDLQEVQNRSGRLSSYADPKMTSEFGKDSGVFEGKNLANVFKIGSTPLWPFTEHLSQVDKGLREVARALALDNADLNTAMRMGEELTDQLIKEKLAAK